LSGKFEVLTGKSSAWSDMLSEHFYYNEKYLITITAGAFELAF